MRIRQIVRVSDQGVSRPYQCCDENGVLRWCKGNHTGLRSLIAEWVCARIARELDEVWSEMPAEWTEAGGEALPLETMKGVLLGRAF